MLKELYNGINKTEISGDFILPDSLPDARAVLHAAASCRKKDQYMKDGKLTYDIEAVYNILYANENNDIQCVKYKSEMSDALSVKGCGPECCAIVTSMPSDTTVRMSNPRKFSIKCHCPMSIKVYTPVYPNADLPNDEDLEVQTESVPSLNIVCGEEEGIAVSEDIEIPKELPEAKELLGVYITPRITELTPSDDKVVFRGEISAELLYTVGGSDYETYTKTFPISAIVPVDGASDDSECLGEIFVYDIALELAPDGEGQMRVAEVDFLYDIRICCTSNTEAQIISDMYYVSKPSESEYKSVSVRSVFGIHNANMSVNEKTPLDDKGVSRILFHTCTVEALKCEPNGKSVTCTGDIIAECIVKKDDQLSSMSLSFPFKSVIDTGALPSDAEFSLCAQTDGGRVRFDSDNAYCDTEVYLTLSVFEKREEKAVASISVGEEEEAEAILPLTLYYPAKGDTVWTVAKKYRSTVADIISANSLTSTDISDRRVLVIPKIRTNYKTV